jgi:hypothetical protein
MNLVITTDKGKIYVKDWGTDHSVVTLDGWPPSGDSPDDQAVAIDATTPVAPIARSNGTRAH